MEKAENSNLLFPDIREVTVDDLFSLMVLDDSVTDSFRVEVPPVTDRKRQKQSEIVESSTVVQSFNSNCAEFEDEVEDELTPDLILMMQMGLPSCFVRSIISIACCLCNGTFYSVFIH